MFKNFKTFLSNFFNMISVKKGMDGGYFRFYKQLRIYNEFIHYLLLLEKSTT